MRTFAALAGVCFLACATPPEATSLLGKPLTRPELDDEFRAKQERLLAEARAAWEANPGDVEAAIWTGRRTAYLGRYGESVEIYSEALRRFPEDPRLYRHRGHRYITLRQLGRAVDDLEQAARLIEGTEDRVEPDGLPNDRGVPTSTLHSNIWYHLGLARYLQGDFEAALAAYRRDLAVSTNPDSVCATSYWLHLTLRRLGREDEAAELLGPIHPAMEIIENHDYHRMLLVFRGELDAEELLADAEAEGGLRFATVGYGVGSLRLAEDRRDAAIALFESILQAGNWPAFGFIAAEAELSRER